MVPLGTLGGVLSEGYDVNAAGHVVGMAATDESGGNEVGHAFLYDETGMHDLGHLGGNFSQAEAINDHGAIVGYSYTSNETTVRGFIWEGGTMLDLNTLIDPALGLRISIARDINNSGQIVALATTRSAVAHPHARMVSGRTRRSGRFALACCPTPRCKHYHGRANGNESATGFGRISRPYD